MARPRKNAKRDIENYAHTDKDAGKTTYAYDPHLDPQLVWTGKAEHTSFDLPTVSLHVHERIDPRSIIEAVMRTCIMSGN